MSNDQLLQSLGVIDDLVSAYGSFVAERTFAELDAQVMGCPIKRLDAKEMKAAFMEYWQGDTDALESL